MEKSRLAQNTAQESSFLGLDFGRAKIGLALADSETRMAFAFGILKNDHHVYENLAKIIKQHQVAKVILGLTKHCKDIQGGQEKKVFGLEVAKKTGVAVEFVDEMFTTKMAQENLKLRGGKKLAKLDDQEAARIILQSWLDK